MWTKEARIQHAPREERYPSDVTDAEWAIIVPMIPPQRDGGRQAACPAYFGAEHGWLETPVLTRTDLASGRSDPLIVEEYDATCVVPPGASAERDAAGNIVIVLGAG
jgi:N-methylhydantoinase A/oxoprolinase/acetone carboxylase beta subunit